MKMRQLRFKVRGVTYEGRQEYLELLQGNEPVQIRPDPENPYDPNALAVWIAVQGIPAHCGFVPKELVADIAPHLEGETVSAVIDEITGGFEINEYERAALGLIIRAEIPDESADLQ